MNDNVHLQQTNQMTNPHSLYSLFFFIAFFGLFDITQKKASLISRPPFGHNNLFYLLRIRKLFYNITGPSYAPSLLKHLTLYIYIIRISQWTTSSCLCKTHTTEQDLRIHLETRAIKWMKDFVGLLGKSNNS